MGNVLIKFKWLENPVNPPVIFSVLVLVAANLAHVNNTEKSTNNDELQLFSGCTPIDWISSCLKVASFGLKSRLPSETIGLHVIQIFLDAECKACFRDVDDCLHSFNLHVYFRHVLPSVIKVCPSILWIFKLFFLSTNLTRFHYSHWLG